MSKPKSELSESRVKVSILIDLFDHTLALYLQRSCKLFENFQDAISTLEEL